MCHHQISLGTAGAEGATASQTLTAFNTSLVCTYWRVQTDESNPFQAFYFEPHSTTRVKSLVESMLHVLLTSPQLKTAIMLQQRFLL